MCVFILDEYLFHELLELVDLDFKAHGDNKGCSQFHFMPRFVRELAGINLYMFVTKTFAKQLDGFLEMLLMCIFS